MQKCFEENELKRACASWHELDEPKSIIPARPSLSQLVGVSWDDFGRAGMSWDKQSRDGLG